MTNFLIHSTSRYALYRDKMGNYTILRLTDGASVYLQGDDTADMDTLAELPADHIVWSDDGRFNACVDGYDDVMSVLTT